MPDVSISRETLSAAQSAAIRNVGTTARGRDATALLSIAGIFERAGYGPHNYSEATKLVRQHALIVLHFHPDRFGCKPATVAESLLSEGMYRNQFETGLSSGSPTGFPGAERDIPDNFSISNTIEIRRPSRAPMAKKIETEKIIR